MMVPSSHNGGLPFVEDYKRQQLLNKRSSSASSSSSKAVAIPQDKSSSASSRRGDGKKHTPTARQFQTPDRRAQRMPTTFAAFIQGQSGAATHGAKMKSMPQLWHSADPGTAKRGSKSLSMPSLQPRQIRRERERPVSGGGKPKIVVSPATLSPCSASSSSPCSSLSSSPARSTTSSDAAEGNNNGSFRSTVIKAITAFFKKAKGSPSSPSLSSPIGRRRRTCSATVLSTEEREIEERRAQALAFFYTSHGTQKKQRIRAISNISTVVMETIEEQNEQDTLMARQEAEAVRRAVFDIQWDSASDSESSSLSCSPARTVEVAPISVTATCSVNTVPVVACEQSVRVNTPTPPLAGSQEIAVQ